MPLQLQSRIKILVLAVAVTSALETLAGAIPHDEPKTFQEYVAMLSKTRHMTEAGVLKSLRHTVNVRNDLTIHRSTHEINLTQDGGFTFAQDISVTSVDIHMSDPGLIDYYRFIFGSHGCVYLPRLATGVGTFSGMYMSAERRYVYGKQAVGPGKVIYRAYMNKGPQQLPDCIVEFDIDLRGLERSDL